MMTIDELLASARAMFAEACDPAGDRNAAMRSLGHAIGALGRLGALGDPRVQAFAAETAPALDALPLSAWHRALARAAEPLTGEDEHYVAALAFRSDVELFKQLYAPLAPGAMYDLDMSELDETLAELAPSYAAPVVPADIPPSHTWWRRPAD